MFSNLFLVFFTFLVIGILCNFFLFTQEKKEKKSTKFITSERLIVFVIEIMIAVIGFGVTLHITNDYEKQVDKEKAIQMLEQTIEYTGKEIETESAYLDMYKNGNIETQIFLNSSVININYYNTILSNELILQNANMNTFGYCMDYLVRIEDTDSRAKTATDDSVVHSEMFWRCQYLKKLRDLLSVCSEELSGNLSPEEALIKCKAIDDQDIRTYP